MNGSFGPQVRRAVHPCAVRNHQRRLILLDRVGQDRTAPAIPGQVLHGQESRPSVRSNYFCANRPSCAAFYEPPLYMLPTGRAAPPANTNSPLIPLDIPLHEPLRMRVCGATHTRPRHMQQLQLSSACRHGRGTLTITVKIPFGRTRTQIPCVPEVHGHGRAVQAH